MNESNPIKYTPPPHSTSRKSPCVRTHTSTSHDSSNHPHSRPRAVRRSTPSHESRLVKSPTPAVRRSKPSFLLCPRRRLDVARRSIASRRLVVVVVDRRRVRVYRANDCANENPLVPSTPRAPARRRRPRRGEREIRRSSNPRSTIRALDATDRGANRRSGDAIARELCARIRSGRIDANESMRTNESMGSDRIDASRRLASASRE